MIEKLKVVIKPEDWKLPVDELEMRCLKNLLSKVDELVDVVNELQLVKDVMFNRIDMLNNAICDIQNRISALDDPTYHEEAQDMYDNAILGALKNKQVDVVVEPAENVQDKFAEQRKWIGKLCKFWDDSDNPENCVYDILCNIFGDLHHEDCPFQCGNSEWYEYCEPVKPDDDIIYKGE